MPGTIRLTSRELYCRINVGGARVSSIQSVRCGAAIGVVQVRQTL